jgi:polyisoprenoid-binding protein YceI
MKGVLMRNFAVLAAFCAFLGFARAEAAQYQIDPTHTHILFMVDHLGFAKMVGLFTDFSGTITFDPHNVEASAVRVTIQTASLDTQNAQRNKDLKGADWFNVAEFPTMTFVGRKYIKKDDKSGTVIGDLTLLGVTRPVSLDVTLNKMGINPLDKKPEVGFSARGVIKRSDFGMKTFLPAIGDEVTILLEVEAKEQNPM